jgi:hypothetical protein
MPLSTGTQIMKCTTYNVGSNNIVIVKPKTVWDTDNRYSTDPKGLYYQRLAQLKDLTTYQINAVVPFESADETYVDTAFPADFNNGIIIGVTAFDVSWVILTGTTSMNLFNEVSDRHQVRHGSPIILPFRRVAVSGSGFIGGIEVVSASTLGQEDDLSLAGEATINYVKLPGGW